MKEYKKNDDKKTFEFDNVNSAIDFFYNIYIDKDRSEKWVEEFRDYSIYENRHGDFLGTVEDVLLKPKKTGFDTFANTADVFYNEKTYWEGNYIDDARMLELAFEYIKELENSLQYWKSN